MSETGLATRPRRGPPTLTAQGRERLIGVLSPLALLILWEISARIHLIDVRFFPAPTAIASTFWDLVQSGELWIDTAISLQRLFWGSLAGGVPALAIGVTMGLSRMFRAIVEPLIAATYPVPKSAIVPLALLIFGLGEGSKVFMVAIGVFFPVVINTCTGVMGIDRIFLDVGRNFGAGRWNTFRTIALPGALPVILTGVRLGLGMGLVLIAIAEMTGARNGLGYLIWSAWQTFAVEQMYVGLFVIALIGFLLNLVLNEVERWLVPWRRV
jgi:ABC-type nitrate/sulfonate/bicarbonate transport system permease component